jgi:hypothetical protein
MNRLPQIVCACLFPLAATLLLGADGNQRQEARMLTDIDSFERHEVIVETGSRLAAAIGSVSTLLQEPPPWAQPTDIQFTAMGADSLQRPTDSAGLRPTSNQEPRP